MKKMFVLLLLLTQLNLNGKTLRPITPEDLWSMKRLGTVTLTDRGAVFEVTEYDIEKNKGSVSLYKINDFGDKPELFINNAYSPLYSKMDKKIYYIKEEKDSTFLFCYDVETDKNDRIYYFPVSPQNGILSTNGEMFFFTAKLYEGSKSLIESAKKKEEMDQNPVTARVIEKLPYRLWSSWVHHYETKLFVIDLKKNDKEAMLLSPDARYVPPLDLGGANCIAVSPDNKTVAFVTNMDEDLSRSTNNDIFLVNLENDNGKITKLTDNPANDNDPVFSPDGDKIAYRAMKRPGFEADQYDLVIYDRKSGKRINYTETFDFDVSNLVWAPEGDGLWFNVLNNGRVMIYSIDLKTKKIEPVVEENFNVLIAEKNGILYFKRQKSTNPYELFSYDLKKDELKKLTYLNENLLSQLEMNELEDFYFDSFDGKKVHGFLLKPPFFDESKKYPMIYLIHGGPQGAWEDDFHYRWNYQLFASRGYVVGMVNFRGSKGYGQDFCDKVSKNWGGGPFKDLMLGLDSLTARHDFIDKEKVAATGASYGGYMINWISVQPESEKFQCLISHAGVYDLFTEYSTTEELWFPEWEMNGNPYENFELYEKWSPSLFAKNLGKYKTPTMVIHGAKDYRVPINQGMQFFTALQTYDVPSKFIYFPDENHFVLQPKNAIFWWNTCFDWIEKWTK